VNHFSETPCLHNIDGCNSIAYGSVVLGLSNINLWPMKNACDIRMSAKNLAAQLLKIKVSILPRSGGKDHRKCHILDADTRVSEILAGFPSPVEDVHRLYMEAAKLELTGGQGEEDDFGFC
jgi:hypothetical protein